MDRSIKTGNTAPRLALAVSTALVSLALAGCATSAAPRGDVSFASAQTALTKGQVDKAIAHAEAAVTAEPRNPGFRALLGAAYLENGRFQSAATSFGDALDLGDENPRTVLSFALAKTATGENRAAVAALDEFAKVIDPADLGLALALAGQPERGLHVLVNAVRNSEPTPKLRQNLAYTYALAGNWRAARVMAAEDVPAAEVDQRLTGWAAMSAPDQYQQRVATLLNITPRADSGQPQGLALANFPSDAVMVAEAAAQAPAEMPVQMAAKPPAPSPAPVAASAPRPAAAAAPAAAPAPSATSTATFAQAFDAPTYSSKPRTAGAATSSSAPRYVSNPVVQQLPAQAQRRTPVAAPVAAVPAAKRASSDVSRDAASDKAANSHLVQLGSYGSKAEATRGWAALSAKFPQLKDHDVVITEALVNGRSFWRVAAAGFGPKSAKSMCGTVKSAGRGCFAYAATNPPAGAVDRGVRMAARTR
jgi:Flp pilus assembly protein TadD